MTARADQQPFADYEFALETATHVSVFSRGMAVENTGLSDNHVPALLQFRFNRPLDDEADSRGRPPRWGKSPAHPHPSPPYLVTPRAGRLRNVLRRRHERGAPVRHGGYGGCDRAPRTL